MTLISKFSSSLRFLNLFFLFPNIFNELFLCLATLSMYLRCPLSGFPSCEVPSVGQFQSCLLLELFFQLSLSTFLINSVSFKRGAKIRTFFIFPKVI